MEKISRKKRSRVSVETVGDFIQRGGTVRKIKSPEIKDSGKYGKQRWSYTMNEVRPEDPDIQRLRMKK